MSNEKTPDNDKADPNVAILGLLNPLLAGGYAAYKAPDDHGWSHGLHTGGGGILGGLLGNIAGQALVGKPVGAVLGQGLGSMYGAHAGYQSAKQKTREALLKQELLNKKESALTKLAARLKTKCPHCGVKHASEGCGCSQRSEPMRDAVRRDRPQAYYPEPTKVAQLREVQKLREKMAWAQLAALGARALPMVARAAPTVSKAMASPAGQFLGRQAGSIAGYGAIGGLAAPEGQRLKGMVAGGVGGLVPGTGIKSMVGATLASAAAGKALGVGA